MPPWRTSNAAKGFTDFQFARDSLVFFDQNQWSQEVQAIGDIGRVKFVADALYYREHVSDIMNDVVHLTGGLRWTKGSKHTRYWSTAMGLDASWSQVDPMVNLAVDFIRDVHVYPYRPNQLYGLIVP